MTLPTAGPPDDLAGEIRALIGQLQEMNRRHQARLDDHRADGEVIPGTAYAVLIRLPSYGEWLVDARADGPPTTGPAS
ncbi:hypothetical protein [Streptomyces jumonjinensis]|uniref:hypothetical protein n=1 Tax=Streptomyces jumonjinensis TaxID=1945 RepID=UPI003789060B